MFVMIKLDFLNSIVGYYRRTNDQEEYVSQKTLFESNMVLPNNLLLILFSVLWLSDCFLTVWAVNNGYIEVWNSWTQLIVETAYIFILVKLISLGMVIGIIRWAKALFSQVIFIALVLFNILIATVLAANIVTIINS
jgi:hypothetical protein